MRVVVWTGREFRGRRNFHDWYRTFALGRIARVRCGAPGPFPPPRTTPLPETYGGHPTVRWVGAGYAAYVAINPRRVPLGYTWEDRP